MMIVPLVFAILVLGALGAGVWWLFRYGAGSRWYREDGASADAAADILRRRFARGEIDREEFEERLRALRR